MCDKYVRDVIYLCHTMGSMDGMFQDKQLYFKQQVFLD